MLSRHPLKILSVLLLFVLFSLVSAYLIYQNIDSLKASANMLKPQPEKFTELYFEDHTALPKNPIIDESNDFGFTIHNLEYQTTRYTYTVTIESDGAKQILDRGEVVLKHDEYKTITESFKLVTDVKRTKITVELVNKKQSIHFWMGEN